MGLRFTARMLLGYDLQHSVCRECPLWHSERRGGDRVPSLRNATEGVPYRGFAPTTFIDVGNIGVLPLETTIVFPSLGSR